MCTSLLLRNAYLSMFANFRNDFAKQKVADQGAKKPRSRLRFGFFHFFYEKKRRCKRFLRLVRSKETSVSLTPWSRTKAKAKVLDGDPRVLSNRNTVKSERQYRIDTRRRNETSRYVHILCVSSEVERRVSKKGGERKGGRQRRQKPTETVNFRLARVRQSELQARSKAEAGASEASEMTRREATRPAV